MTISVPELRFVKWIATILSILMLGMTALSVTAFSGPTAVALITLTAVAFPTLLLWLFDREISPRFRRVILVLGSTACTLIVAAAVGSWWCKGSTLNLGSRAFTVVPGGVKITTSYWSPRWKATNARWSDQVVLDLLINRRKTRDVTIPLWLPVLLAAIPTFLVWRFVPKFARGHCRRCGYNLTGLTEARCPECGAEFGEAREI